MSDKLLESFDRLLKGNKQPTPIVESKAPVREPVEEASAPKAPAPGKEYTTVEQVVESIVAFAREEYDTDEALLSEDYDDEDLSQLRSILTRLVTESGDQTLDEAKRKIMKLVGGKIKRVTQELSSRAERLKAKIARRKNRAAIRKAGKKYRKSAGGKKMAKKRAKAMKAFRAKNPSMVKESSGANALNALLESTQVVTAKPATDLHVALTEAYNYVEHISGMLHNFFESNAVGSDHKELVSVAKKLEETAAQRCTLMESANTAPDLASLVNQVKVLSRLVEAFEQYKVFRPVYLGN